MAVDLSLFPIDTLKTRLQAKGGFVKNGGFHGVYRGLGSILVGSAPGGMKKKKESDLNVWFLSLVLTNDRHLLNYLL